MSHRLGVDVGGTFTDLLLIEESSGRTWRAKVPSTPSDSSLGVLAGIDRICGQAGIDADRITNLLHGTTVATNAILEGKGARVGVITTEGFRFLLHTARSHIPGGLGGWIIHPKPEPLAPLELTVEVRERIDRRGEVIVPLDERHLQEGLVFLRGRGVDAITVALINSYVNDAHERRIQDIVRREMPDVPVSISSAVLPEMLEYERAQTGVVNSYVRPVVAGYLANLEREMVGRDMAAHLHILRSDGGLASTDACRELPVSILMSGPAGGVAGALWIAGQSGHSHLLTLDMGGTSTDVALIEGGAPRLRRETAVGDITVRASSLDVRTVGAGGGSIAHVPEITRALRVGPESAGAEPGPALYGKGGDRPTVTDAHAVLGHFPNVVLAGEMQLDMDAATRAVRTVADALGLDLHRAARGILDIANETMFGALRGVSIQQGYDPRDFGLIAFGGAGPMHANALALLMDSWPVIIPPSPGVLCAYGDATTRLRNEASRSVVRRFSDTTDDEVHATMRELADRAAVSLDSENVPRSEQLVDYEMDCRYHGQGLQIPVKIDIDAFRETGLAAIAAAFDDEHEKLFTFRLDGGHEMVNLRAIVQAAAAPVEALRVPRADGPDASEALVGRCRIFSVEPSAEAAVYDRTRLKCGHRLPGPAIVTEMDSTTLILPGHVGEVDHCSSIIISPATGA